MDFLAVGGMTYVLWPICWLLQKWLGLDLAEYWTSLVAFYAAAVINDPHFAVTYLLFYRNVRSRALGSAFPRWLRLRYWVAGFLVPSALIVWGAWALLSRSAIGLGWMFQLMFLLVSWHYVKQGFGVLTVLSARRGVRFTPLERRVVLGHCFSAWAFGWSRRPFFDADLAEQGVLYHSISVPNGLAIVSGIAFFGSTAALFAMLVNNWRKGRALPPLAALMGLLTSVWLWTVYSAFDPLMLYLIPALHSLQYLYFVWLLKRNEAQKYAGPAHFRKPSTQLWGLAISSVVLGLILMRGSGAALDAVFDATQARLLSDAAWVLGPTPFFATVVTIVNLHHYFMDNVIWRRENPQTQLLTM